MALIALIACLTEGASPAADPQPPSLPRDLAWIPPSCAGFVHIRFAELYQTSVGKNATKVAQALEPKAVESVQREIGIPLAHLDRITLVIPDVHERRPPGVVVRLTTSRPYNRRDVITAFKARPFDGQEQEERNTHAELYEARDDSLLHLTDDQNITIVFDKYAAASLLGQLLRSQADGPLTPALRLAAEKNHLVAAVNIARFPRIPADDFPPELRRLRPLLDAKTLLVRANLVGETAQVDLRLSFAGREDSAEGKQLVDDAFKLLLDQLAASEKRLAQSAKEHSLELELLRVIQATLRTAKVGHAGNEVTAELQAPAGATVTRLLAGGVEALRTNAARTQSQNNLKQIGLAFHNYASTYGTLPPAAICDKNGKPLLSWRVAILPFIEQDNLYKQFHLDEPWDSEHNLKLAKVRIKVYTLPVAGAKESDLPLTHYLALVGNGGAFELRKGLTFPADFPDGLSNTIWIVEAENGVPWTKPEDIAYDPKVMPKLGTHFGERVNCAFADGAVRAIKKSVKESTWHLLFQRNDGHPIPDYDN